MCVQGKELLSIGQGISIFFIDWLPIFSNCFLVLAKNVVLMCKFIPTGFKAEENSFEIITCMKVQDMIGLHIKEQNYDWPLCQTKLV